MRRLTKKDWGIIIGIYIAAILMLTLRNHLNIISDRASEYHQFLLVIEDNGAFSFNNGLVASSFLSVWLPGVVYRLTHWNPIVIFNFLPVAVFSLMPVATYLIAREYTDSKRALLAAGLVLGSFYFTFQWTINRVQIAWGFAGLLAWALVSGRTKTAVAFGLLLTLSHYGTTFLMLFVMVFVVIGLIIQHRWGSIDLKRQIRNVGIATLALGIFASVWYFGVADSTGRTVTGFIRKSITLDSPTLERPTILHGRTDEEDAIRREFAQDSPLRNFFKMESRDMVVQSAFGMTWKWMNAGQKIEFVLSWAVVAILSFGLLLSMRYQLLSPVHLYLAIGLYGVTAVSVLLPHLSVYYGAVRTYFTALPVLASCFVMPSYRWVSRKVLVGLVVVAVAYGLSTSGVMHWFLGLTKGS